MSVHEIGEANRLGELLGVSLLLEELIRAMPSDDAKAFLEYVARNHDLLPSEEEDYDTLQRDDERNTAHDLW